MPSVLLKPYCLQLKNRIFGKPRTQAIARDLLYVFLVVLFLWGISSSCLGFIERLTQNPEFSRASCIKLLHFLLFAFQSLLLISACISALNLFFFAQDLPISLAAPVSISRIVISRSIANAWNCSWMFMLFTAPALVGFGLALNLGWAFLVTAILLFIPFILIPSLVASLFVLTLVSLFNPNRLRDTIVLLACIVASVVLAVSGQEEGVLPNEEQQVGAFIHYLETLKVPDIWGSPSHSVATILGYFVDPAASFPWGAVVCLLLVFAVVLAATLLSYERHYLQALGEVSQTKEASKTHLRKVIQPTHWSVPLPMQFRAIAVKEVRMFWRDTTQSLQLLMLLMLTFVYIYNFRSLRLAPMVSKEAIVWWQLLLAVSNIGFGGCVIAAICARFVFPSVSLEGRAYSILRSTPLSIDQLVKKKFQVWLVPMSGLGLVLLLSGAFAIQAPISNIVATAIIALSMSYGIVGLAIGLGAMFARFDWEHSSQVVAGLGSLAFLVLSFFCISVTIVPSAILFCMTTVPELSRNLDRQNHALLLAALYFMIFALNYLICKKALSAGVNKLQDLET